MQVVCHCENCQRQTGTALSVVVAVPRGSLTISGEDRVKTYVDRGTSGKSVRRRFCGDCGSPLFTEPELMPEVDFIKAGTLHDRSWLEPTVHFWCDRKQPWICIEDGVETVPGNPG